MKPILVPLVIQARSAGGGDDSWKLFQIGAIVLGGVFLLFMLVLLMKYAKLYVRSVTTNAGVGLLNMFAMSLRKVDPTTIVDAKVMLVQARIEGISTRDIEAHYLAGGTCRRSCARSSRPTAPGSISTSARRRASTSPAATCSTR